MYDINAQLTEISIQKNIKSKINVVFNIEKINNIFA